MPTTTFTPSSYGTTVFTTPGNMATSNNVYSTATPGKSSSLTQTVNFDMSSIPANATVNSAVLYWEHKESVTGLAGETLTVTLTGNGNTFITGYSSLISTTEHTDNCDFTAYAQSNINYLKNGFSVDITASKGSTNTTVTYSIDYVYITVDYTVPVSVPATVSASVTTSSVAANPVTVSTAAPIKSVLMNVAPAMSTAQMQNKGFITYDFTDSIPDNIIGSYNNYGYIEIASSSYNTAYVEMTFDTQTLSFYVPDFWLPTPYNGVNSVFTFFIDGSVFYSIYRDMYGNPMVVNDNLGWYIIQGGNTYSIDSAVLMPGVHSFRWEVLYEDVNDTAYIYIDDVTVNGANGIKVTAQDNGTGGPVNQTQTASVINSPVEAKSVTVKGVTLNTVSVIGSPAAALAPAVILKVAAPVTTSQSATVAPIVRVNNAASVVTSTKTALAPVVRVSITAPVSTNTAAAPDVAVITSGGQTVSVTVTTSAVNGGNNIPIVSNPITACTATKAALAPIVKVLVAETAATNTVTGGNHISRVNNIVTAATSTKAALTPAVKLQITATVVTNTAAAQNVTANTQNGQVVTASVIDSPVQANNVNIIVKNTVIAATNTAASNNVNIAAGASISANVVANTVAAAAPSIIYQTNQNAINSVTAASNRSAASYPNVYTRTISSANVVYSPTTNNDTSIVEYTDYGSTYVWYSDSFYIWRYYDGSDHIEYLYVYFRNLSMPQNTPINAASVALTVSNDNGMNTTLNTYVEYDSYPFPHDVSGTSSLNLTPISQPILNTAAGTVFTVDVTAALQSIVNNAAYVPGNNAFLFKLYTLSSLTSMVAFYDETDATRKPKLNINYATQPYNAMVLTNAIANTVSGQNVRKDYQGVSTCGTNTLSPVNPKVIVGVPCPVVSASVSAAAPAVSSKSNVNVGVTAASNTATAYSPAVKVTNYVTAATSTASLGSVNFLGTGSMTVGVTAATNTLTGIAPQTKNGYAVAATAAANTLVARTPIVLVKVSVIVSSSTVSAKNPEAKILMTQNIVCAGVMASANNPAIQTQVYLRISAQEKNNMENLLFIGNHTSYIPINNSSIVSIFQSKIEVRKVALVGDTIKLRMEFRDFNGVLFDPTTITITTYQNYDDVLENINVPLGSKVSTGIYEYLYTVPAGDGPLTYEVKGVVGTTNSVVRKKLPREWVR